MMELDLSPRHSPGGSLNLLSPTHAHGHAVDGLSAIRQLRRSLSRSPSKPPRYTIYSTPGPAAISSTAQAPRSPSTLNRTYSADFARVEHSAAPPSHRSGLTRTRSRRTSPNSPLRRVLSDTTNQANATPRAPNRRSLADYDQENMDCSEDTSTAVPELRIDDGIKLDFARSGPDKHLQPVKRELASPMKSSPLKRSDGVMNLEAAKFGSPRSRKRRSLHSPMNTDFNIFESSFESANSDSADSNEEKEKENASNPGLPPPASPLRRTNTLRKSTLQQRTVHTRSARDSVMTSSSSRTRGSRFSLDGSLPLRPSDADSPFRKSTYGNSLASLFPPQPPPSIQVTPKPHPLSKALSPSSSTSSVVDAEAAAPQAPGRSEKPVVHMAAPPIPRPAFSKSLPIGAMRPATSDTPSGESFETPAGFRMAKPLPQAFLSTGLISKRNRHVDASTAGLFSSVNMPDTPSKKAPPIHVSHTPAPPGTLKSSKALHEFGSPSTPSYGCRSMQPGETYGKGLSIFNTKTNAPLHARSTSLLSTDGEEVTQSPTKHLHRQVSIDELPPTPTKSTSSTTAPVVRGKSSSLRSSLFGRRTSMGPDTFVAPGSREQSPPAGDDEGDAECEYNQPDPPRPVQQSDAGWEASSDVARPHISLTECTTPISRARPAEQSDRPVDLPSPLATRSFRSLPLLEHFAGRNAKMNLSPASSPMPRKIRRDEPSPHTPQESFTPPDPSSLSISMEHRGSLFNSHSFPPATPTGPRGEASFKVSIGPGHAFSSYFGNDVDTSLTTKFESVTCIGAGEFSQVYKVEKPTHAGRTDTRSRLGPGSNVWAVKKSRKPIVGERDRQHKMQEVRHLRALNDHEHIVRFADVWESNDHLYIQTEFCENGNLKDFLLQTGFKGRLDDFRIWKILLELSRGVQSIHDANIIHLDLKPANVFIDWEGVLKIGDFGMASGWPAPAGLDGEGDREYIGPEVLEGRFDKPADIFSLGMIMLEIAGNIVLPDNGTSWQRLRSGDMQDVPSLTSSSDSSLTRDETGELVQSSSSSSAGDAAPAVDDGVNVDDDDDLSFLRPSPLRKPASLPRSHDLVTPPNFMIDSDDPESLDQVVQWMIRPNPLRRPRIDQLLGVGGVAWVNGRRRAGATVYEGVWGPADSVLNHGADDIEMPDI